MAIVLIAGQCLGHNLKEVANNVQISNCSMTMGQAAFKSHVGLHH